MVCTRAPDLVAEMLSKTGLPGMTTCLAEARFGLEADVRMTVPLLFPFRERSQRLSPDIFAPTTRSLKSLIRVQVAGPAESMPISVR
ncbi:hypothetical protein ASE89_14225 [Sphingomonas sp. Leaf30]|nr:hypothetical protein ASE89_14225 [Sphingomonas sp. Leaf30]